MFRPTDPPTPARSPQPPFPAPRKAGQSAARVNRHFRRKETHQERTTRRTFNIKTDKLNYIVNLSSKTLSAPQTKVLNKGLGFVPSTPEVPDLKSGIGRLARTLRLKHFFKGEELDPNTRPPPFRKKSTWQPPPADEETESYLALLPVKLDDIPTLAYRPNLKKAEEIAIKQLSRDESLVIRKADKGSVVVVEDRSNYIADGLAHLADKEIYRPLPHDPTQQLCRAINRLIQTARTKGFLSKQMRDYLLLDPENTRTQQAYFLKKLHKGPREVRPIVSGVNGPTEKLSAFIDYYLQPLIPSIPSYIKDSAHLIRILEQEVLDRDCILATIDVRALYPSIPQEEGLQTAINALYDNNPAAEEIPFPRATAEVVMRTILRENFFEFNGQMYQQLRGTAMGTRMAPSFANIFMAKLEQKLQENTRPRIWRRFIDDIFVAWEGSEESLTSFLANLNDQHPTIKFTWEVSRREVTFLDLTIRKGKRFEGTGILDVSPHFKSTNAFQYVHYSSSHPRSTHKAVVKGELTRILRACSDEEEWRKVSHRLMEKFVARGYPRTMLNTISAQVPHTSRHEVLKEKKKAPGERVPFITTHSDRIPKSEISRALKPSGEIPPPPLLCFKVEGHLSKKLVRARLRSSAQPPAGGEEPKLPTRVLLGRDTSSQPCGRPNCSCCNMMSKKQRVFSSDDVTQYRTQPRTNCDSAGLVYLLECTTCESKNMYVGQTARTLKERMAGHRAAFNGNKNMPIYQHLRKKSHPWAGMKVTILEKISHPTEERLKEREKEWMRLLRTRIPQGLNSNYN